MAEQAERPRESNAWRLPVVLRAHWRLFLVTFLLLLIGSVVAAYVRKPMYESAVRLYVQLDQPGMSLSQADTRSSPTVRMAEEAVATQAEMLAARDIVAQLVDQLGVSTLGGRPPADTWVARMSARVRNGLESVQDTMAAIGLITRLSPRDDAIRSVQKELRIFPVRKTQVIHVSFRSRHREVAPLVLETLVAIHLKKLAQINAYSEDYEFYNQQTSRFREELQSAEERLAAFKVKNGIVDAATEKAMLMHRIDQLTTMLDGVARGSPAQNAQNTEASERGLLTSSKPAEASVGASNLSPLASRLIELRLERARRINLYADKHALIQEMDSQIASAELLLAREMKQMVTTVNAYKARLAKLERLEPELNRHLRDSQASAHNFKAFSSATEDRRLAREQKNRVVVMVVDAPSIPDAPLSPSRLTMIVFGLSGALLLALATVLFREWLGRKLVQRGR